MVGERVIEARILIPDGGELSALLGPADEHLGLLREAVRDVDFTATRDALLLTGEPAPVEAAQRVVGELLDIVRGGQGLQRGHVEYAVRSLSAGELGNVGEELRDAILVTERGKSIRARTPGQRRYIQALREHTVTFGVGPAGTGKTYLAMASAVASLRSKEVSRIILCRPAVEAGERLGFLPGDLQAKIDPYLRPLYDALYEFLGVDRAQRYIERGIVEVAPLAFMRGRTLNDAFVILDEAQNATAEQMKMFLTRLGFGSKAAVTGDLTQTDLPRDRESGLRQSIDLLGDLDGIAVCRLGSADVVRHALVQRIVEAYDRLQAERAAGLAARAERDDAEDGAGSGPAFLGT